MPAPPRSTTLLRISTTQRSRWYGIAHHVQRRLANPLAKRLAPHVHGLEVLETIGRNSGLPRETPIGGRLDGRTFWMVSEFGRQSNYVRNLEENPRVRLQIDGVWHTGLARTVPEDNPRKRLRSLGGLNSFAVRSIGSELLSIRVDLD